MRQIVEKSRESATRALKPLAAIGGAVIQTSQTCRDGIRPWVVASDELDFGRKLHIAFCEFAWFFIHWTMRCADSVMTESEMAHLAKHLIAMVVSLTVDGTFENLPDNDLRRRMIVEFRTNLYKADHEYSNCARCNIFATTPEEGAAAMDALWQTLARNIAAVIGRQSDTETEAKIAAVASEQLMGVEWIKLIVDFARDSMGLPDDYLDS